VFLLQAAEKLLSGVILSRAKDLLFARAESKADPSDAQSRRDLRMHSYEFFRSLLGGEGKSHASPVSGSPPGKPTHGIVGAPGFFRPAKC
jgi:hypothetical protein